MSDYSMDLSDYSMDHRNDNNTIIEYTNEDIQIMLTILLFLSCLSPFIHTFNGCIKNIKNRYSTFILSVYKITSNDNLLLDECPICLEKYVVNDKILNLECNHKFHKGCLSEWLKNNNTCPQCRENII